MSDMALGPDGKYYPKDPVGNFNAGPGGAAARADAGTPDNFVYGGRDVDPSTGNSDPGYLGYNADRASSGKSQNWDYYKNTHGLSGDALSDYNAMDAHIADSADYGGMHNGAKSMADYYRGRMGDNDAAQASALAGQQWASRGLQGSRGNMASEDPRAVAAEAQSRSSQLSALSLMGNAAAGGAPSAAAGQTTGAMNDLMAQRAGATGGARGLASLTGSQGGADVGMAASGIGTGGGLARSKEITDAMQQYGGLAGNVRGGDLGRMSQSTNMSKFNADLNNQHKLDMGQIGLNYGNLGSQLGNQDREMYKRAMHGYDVQGDADQERKEWMAQNEASRVGGAIAASSAKRRANEDLAYDAGGAAVGAIGSVGGPALAGAATAGYGYAAGKRP